MPAILVWECEMRTTFSLALAFSFSAFAGQAATIDTTTCSPLNVVSCTVGGATVTASGPANSVLRLVDFRGNSAIGVGRINQDADRRKEIEGGTTEALTVTFDTLSIIESVTLAAFYNPIEFSNDPQEIALITGFFGDNTSKTLSIRNNSNTPGDFTVNDASLFTAITRLDVGKGLVEVTDLFMGRGVSRLVFTAGDTPKGNDNSDYAVASVIATPVPLPAAGWMLIAGVGALAAAGRRRRQI